MQRGAVGRGERRAAEAAQRAHHLSLSPGCSLLYWLARRAARYKHSMMPSTGAALLARNLAVPLLERALGSGGAAPPPALRLLAAAALSGARQLCSSAAVAAAADAGAAGAGLGAAAAAEDVPVLIAGGGPTGLTTALLLAKCGVRSLVLEKARTLTDHPQAHLINMRCMEVFRALGGAAPRTLCPDSDVATCITQLMPPLATATQRPASHSLPPASRGMSCAPSQIPTSRRASCSRCRPWSSGAALCTAPAWGAGGCSAWSTTSSERGGGGGDDGRGGRTGREGCRLSG